MSETITFCVILYLCLSVGLIRCETPTAENGNDRTSRHGNRVDQDPDPGMLETLVHRTATLEKQVEQQGEINERLQLKLATAEEELAILKSSRDCAGDKLSVEDANNLSAKDPHSQHRRAIGLAQPGGVAFTAYLNHNVTHLGIDNPIVYNKVLLNEGGAYNENTGVFRCPVDGIYVFNFMVATNGIMQIVAKLVVDNVNMLDGIADTYHTHHEAQGGNYATLSLRAGQSVWVANTRWTDKAVFNSNQSRFSSFSGHLVTPTNGGPLSIVG